MTALLSLLTATVAKPDRFSWQTARCLVAYNTKQPTSRIRVRKQFVVTWLARATMPEEWVGGNCLWLLAGHIASPERYDHQAKRPNGYTDDQVHEASNSSLSAIVLSSPVKSNHKLFCRITYNG